MKIFYYKYFHKQSDTESVIFNELQIKCNK